MTAPNSGNAIVASHRETCDSQLRPARHSHNTAAPHEIRLRTQMNPARPALTPAPTFTSGCHRETDADVPRVWKELRTHKQKTDVFKTLDTGDIVRDQDFSYAFGATSAGSTDS